MIIRHRILQTGFLFVMFGLIMTGCKTGSHADELKLHYILAGIPDDNTVILQARAAKTDTLVEEDIQGRSAVLRFEYASNRDFEGSMLTDWIQTNSQNDYIAREQLTGLVPGTKYYYRCCYGKDIHSYAQSETSVFTTAYGQANNTDVSFVMVTGSHYYRFKTGGQGGGDGEPFPPAGMEELKKGFPGHEQISLLEPDFWIGNGDNVYYDHPAEEAATDSASMRAHWHRLYSMPRFRQMLRQTATLWLKDDHDHRFDDSDTSNINKGKTREFPSHSLGMAIFREQTPMYIDSMTDEKPYRTIRLNKYLQIWLVEGRDFRSPNNLADGPGKSIWGKEQYRWLKKTLLESDADFKLLLSPTPLVGPDDNWKTDNHCNINGFQYERDNFFDWLNEQELIGNGFYILCGDRHWQYHSIHPDGVEEFSCGALVDANSRFGRIPGDPVSTDPGGLIRQVYLQSEPSGGFLHVSAGGDTIDASPVLIFSFFDDEGELLYREIKKTESLPDP